MFMKSWRQHLKTGIFQDLLGRRRFGAAAGRMERPRRPSTYLEVERLEDRWVPALTYHAGGPLIQNIQAEAIYYSPWNTNATLQTQKTTLDNYLTYITNSPYMDMLSQYNAGGQTIGRGAYNGADSNFPNATTTTITIGGNNYPAISESQIQKDLSTQINAGMNNLTTPNGNTLYFVFTPPGDVVTSGTQNSVNGFFAFHNWFHDSTSDKDVFYAVIPYDDGNPNSGYSPLTTLQLTEEAVSHEMAEAVTDPKINAWYDDNLGGSGEIGDLENINYSTLNGYVVQDEWSNAANGPMRATGTNFYLSQFQNPTEGQFNGVIGTFIDTSGSGNLSNTSISWGDGSPQTGLTVQKVNSTTFNLIGSHTYALEEGTTENLSIWITLADGSQAHAIGQLGIANSAKPPTTFNYNDLGLVTLQDAPLTPIAVTANGTEGTTLNNQLVGQFTDPGTDGTNADYTATITWDDGSGVTHMSTGTVSLASGTTFNVYGTNSTPYAEEGTYNVTIVVKDVGGQSTTINSKVKVADPSVTPMGNFTFNAMEGAPSVLQTVATFTDPAGAEVLVDYSATIAWGDGSTSSGAIAFDSGSGTFTVSGAHTYGEEGTFTITTSIHHDAASDASITSTAKVIDPAVVAGGVGVTAVEGAAFTASISTFMDPGGPEPNASDPGALANHYTVDSIDWGDATPLDTTSGTISFDGSTTFTVQGSHTYGEEGSSYTITAIINHEGMKTTVTTTATVSDPAVVSTAVPVFAVECRTITVSLATFTDPGGPEPNASDPGALANHYKIDSINWGDSTPLDTTSGTISFDGTSTFTVQGTHAYMMEGVYTVTVVIDHESVLTTQTTTATIKDDIGLLLLDPTGAQSLQVNGNGIVDATGCGAVIVDSNNSTAALISGHASVTAEDIDITGGAKTTSGGTFSRTVDHEAPTADPLGLGLPPAPSPTFAAVNYSGSAPLTLNPGTYVGGIKLSGTGAVTLNPGVYYMKGGGFSVNGQEPVTGNNVLIVNAPVSSGDAISISGQAHVTLTGLTSGPDMGVVMLQNPASSVPVSFSGQSATITLTGVVYVPNALVSISGNAFVTIDPGAGTATLPPYLGALIAFDLHVGTNGVLVINPDPPGVATMATVAAGANSTGLTSGSSFLPAGVLPTSGQSVTSATVTNSGSTTLTATPTSTMSGSGVNTGGTGVDASFAPAKQSGGSVWDLINFSAADLISGLQVGDIVTTI